MPLVRVTLRKGKSPEYVKEVGEAIHAALVATANVPMDDRFQIFDEVEPDRLIADAAYAGMSRSPDLLIVEITLNVGRTLDVKKALYAAIVTRLGQSLDIRPDDVLINLVEVPKENWSFGKGLATYG